MANYNVNRSSLSHYWDHACYGGLLNVLHTSIQLAEESGEVQYVAISNILMARELGILTSSYGDIPYSQAFDIKKLKVPYDTQEEIYLSIQELLDEAIAILESSSGAIEGDLIFNGDYTRWVQTAHALKARYYMHLSKRDPNAFDKALSEIELAFGSNASQPDFQFGPNLAAGSPFTKLSIERASFTLLADHLYNQMSDASDPRLSSYVGERRDIYDESQNGLFWNKSDATIPLISFSEVKFMEAEALIRIGDVLDAQAALREAVRSNLEYLNIDENEIDSYMNSQANFDGLTTDEQRIEKIINEKYVALYFQGAVELWVDYRRTGYPTLVPSEYGENELNPGGQIPQRLVYTSNEYRLNKENVERAAENIGGDLLSTKLWAFQ